MSGVLSFPFGGVYVLLLFGAGSLILGVLFLCLLLVVLLSHRH